MGKNRSKSEIIEGIYQSILAGNDNPGKIKDHIKIKHDYVKENLLLIQQIQAMPKLRIDVAGRYWKVSFEEESSIEIPDPDEKITPIKSKQKIIKTKAKVTKESVKKNDKKTLPKKGIEEEEGNIYLEELKEIWKEAKAYPKFTEIMQVLRGLKKVNPKEIRKICIRIYEDENAISDELEFNESVKETVDVVAGRLTDEEFEKRN